MFKRIQLLAFCAIFTISSYAEISVGDPARELRVRKWLTREHPDLEVLAGKVHLIQFWATWCPYCVDCIPKMNEISNKYSSEGLVVVGISVDKKQYAVTELMKKKDFDYAVAIDGGSKSIYEVKAFPFAVLIDAYGKIKWSGHTGNDSLTNAIEKELLEAPTPVFKDIDLSDFEEIDIPLKKGTSFAKIYKILKYNSEKSDGESKTKATEIINTLDKRVEEQFNFASKIQENDKETAIKLFMNIAKNYRGPDISRDAIEKIKDIKQQLAEK